MRGFLVFAAVAGLIVAIAACGEDYKDCYGEDLIACSCGAAQGYAKCENGSYKTSVCVCDGTTPGVDAGKDAAAAAPTDAATTPEAGVCTREGGLDDSGAFKKDFEVCANADECEGCRCEVFQAKLLCTRPCASDADCTNGCNQRGICRNP